MKCKNKVGESSKKESKWTVLKSKQLKHLHSVKVCGGEGITMSNCFVRTFRLRGGDTVQDSTSHEVQQKR